MGKILGPYDPLRDECLAWSVLLPGLSVKEWLLDFPGTPFPTYQRVDRGFPARYEEFLQQHRFDVDLLYRIGEGQGFDDRLLLKMQEELKQSQWWPIADFAPLENDKFGTTDRQVDGHNLPAHQCLFGYYDKAVWRIGTHGEQRSIYAFDTDERDGDKEDDLYGLTELSFEFTDAELKLATKRVWKWWHPDQVAHRTVYERNQDRAQTDAPASFSKEEMQRASEKFVWHQNAQKVLSDKWCRRFRISSCDAAWD